MLRGVHPDGGHDSTAWPVMLEAAEELVNKPALMVAGKETSAFQARGKPTALRLTEEFFS